MYAFDCFWLALARLKVCNLSADSVLYVSLIKIASSCHSQMHDNFCQRQFKCLLQGREQQPEKRGIQNVARIFFASDNKYDFFFGFWEEKVLFCMCRLK